MDVERERSAVAGMSASGDHGDGRGNDPGRTAVEDVPCAARSDGTLQFVWLLPYGLIVIDVHPDGTVTVNGSAVEPAARAASRTPVARAA